MLSTEAIRMPHAAPAEFYPDPAEKLRSLSAWHDDLDLAIGALIETGRYDDLAITRLKKRKLQIKDEIAGVMAATPAAPPDTDVPAAEDLRAEPAPHAGLSPVLVVAAFLAALGLVSLVVIDSADAFVAKLLLLAMLTGGG